MRGGGACAHTLLNHQFFMKLLRWKRWTLYWDIGTKKIAELNGILHGILWGFFGGK